MPPADEFGRKVTGIRATPGDRSQCSSIPSLDEQAGETRDPKTTQDGANPVRTDGGTYHQDHDDHDHHEVGSVTFGVLTVSTSRTLDDDESGDALVDVIEAGGYSVQRRELVGDQREQITATAQAMIEADEVDTVVITGGTGLSPTDVTVEAVRPLFDQRIPGFGELFRYLSYEDIGPRALLSRACAGSRDGVPVFCLPGSKQGATFGVEQLVVPTIAHVLGHTQGKN